MCFSCKYCSLTPFCVTTTVFSLALLPFPPPVSVTLRNSCWKDRSALAAFTRKPCSGSSQTPRTADCPPDLRGWAFSGRSYERRSTKSLWFTWRTLRPGATPCIPTESSTRRIQRVRYHTLHPVCSVNTTACQSDVISPLAWKLWILVDQEFQHVTVSDLIGKVWKVFDQHSAVGL